MDDYYEEEESDGLVQSTFIIPCASSSTSHRDQPGRIGFPILSKYEQNAGPSNLRRTAFSTARKEVVRAFENTLSSSLDPTIVQIESFCVSMLAEPSSYFIPGSSAEGTARRLSVASLIGPQISRQFFHRLKNKILKRKGYRWASLQPRECVSLAATIRLLVANLMLQDSSPDLGLSSLSILSSSTTAVIYLRSIGLFKYTVLNDVLKAIHSAAQTYEFPRIVLLLGVEGGSGSLDDKVDSESMHLMDLHRISLPHPSIAFDTLIQKLFLSSDVETSIWFGPSVLELLRYQYYERGFDLDKMLSILELSIHHHFTTRPLSAIAAVASDNFDSGDWKSTFFDRVRLHIIEADKNGNISLPRPGSDATLSKQGYLRSLLTDDEALLASMADFTSATGIHRANIRRAIHLLHTLRTHFLNHASSEGGDEFLLEPKKSSLGGLAWHIISDQDVSKLISAVIGAIRKASVRQLKDALEEVLSYDWSLEEKTFQERMIELIGELQVEVEKEQMDEMDMVVDVSEKQRMEKVQARLLREESSDTLKRKVADWIRAIIESWSNSRPILSQVWSYDFSNYLNQLCDPSPRGVILAALNDSSLSMKSEEGRNIPDICQLYQVYQSAGKMINLSDLFQAFSQAIQAGKSTSSSKKRSRNSNTRNDDQEDDAMQRKDAVQARFALAINEMGKMGFMKKTRRKQDHVLKVVHDLSSTSVTV